MHQRYAAAVASLVAASATVLVVACSSTPAATPDPLEIGVRATDGTFTRLSDGDTVRATPASMGATKLVPALRALGIDPRAPEPTVEVTVGGLVMAANLAGPRADMVADGAGYVLWDLNVQFQTQPCCYACSEGTIVASLRDSTGKRFEGDVTVQLDPGGGCPDPAACCATADACPSPALTQLCM